MDEQRLESYLKLIDQLLERPSDCLEILSNNFSLIDKNFVATLTQMVKVLEKGNEHDAAAFLNSVAYQIFLSQLIQVAYESNISSQVIYPLLEANLDKLDDNFAQLLGDWAIQALSTLEGTEALRIAVLISDLCIQLAEFPQGNQASNLEIAIKGCEAVLMTIFARDKHSQGWALNQSTLGNFYGERVRGDRAENLEKAIACHENSLQVWTYENFPESWALTQNNLANTYGQRIKGERAKNIEQAIQHCRNALKIRTYESFPEYWADTQINLGNAYLYRILSDRAENLEQAIICYQNALQVDTYNTFPEDWASIQSNLGSAYLYRIHGKRSENLEKSISCYKEALKVRTLEDFPYLWAETQNSLGEAYRIRIEGVWIENFIQAIASYERALKVWTFDAFPEQWAMIQTNLGETYRTSRARNLAENFERAISSYENALRVYSRDAFPERWATIQNNLGAAYAERIEGNKEKNLEQAITYFQNALQVHTKGAFPHYYVETLHNLGLAYQETKQFQSSYLAFISAVETIEILRDEVISGTDIKQKLARDWHDIYRNVVKVSLELGYYKEAIEYAERSKTRNLVELIFSRDIHKIFPSRVSNQLEKLRNKIASNQSQIQAATADGSTELAEKLQQLRRQRNELQDRYLPIGSSFDFDSFQSTLDSQTVILEWYILDDCILTFLITQQSLQLIWHSSLENLKELELWTSQYLRNYRNTKSQWKDELPNQLHHLSTILNLDEILTHPEVAECQCLILIPHRYLHLLPLHSLPLPNGNLILDCFEKGISYIPSCQLLQLTQRQQHFNFQNLFVIQNPTEDLIYTDLEVEFLRSFFPIANILTKEEATRLTLETNYNLLSAHCVHFSCHGEFNLEFPLESALILANKEYLTLREIFELRLSQCRLIILSACETGMTDPTSISDEYVGLPSGFLCAGTPAIVSSLWTVNDLSTTLLMVKFYKTLESLLPLKAGDVALALNQSQKWLRHLTVEQFDEEIIKLQPKISEFLGQLRPGQRLIFQESLKTIRQRQPYPFVDPYYWAAFTAIGL
jgi:CHAT domain-containing protein